MRKRSISLITGLCVLAVGAGAATLSQDALLSGGAPSTGYDREELTTFSAVAQGGELLNPLPVSPKNDRARITLPKSGEGTTASLDKGFQQLHRRPESTVLSPDQNSETLDQINRSQHVGSEANTSSESPFDKAEGGLKPSTDQPTVSPPEDSDQSEGEAPVSSEPEPPDSSSQADSPEQSSGQPSAPDSPPQSETSTSEGAESGNSGSEDLKEEQSVSFPL